MKQTFPKYTPEAVIRDVQKYFDFLVKDYGYFIANCYFDRPEYWGVKLTSYSERLGIWVASERYVTLYLSLPMRQWKKGEAKAISIPKAVTLAKSDPALQKACGYASGREGIRRCARFLKQYYPVLKNLAERSNWLLDEMDLEEDEGKKPIVGHWKYKEPCWVRAKDTNRFDLSSD